MTQPSGFPPGGGGGVEIVDKITPPAPGRIIYLTERYEDRYKESDFNITMTVGEIGGNGDKIGFATAPAAAAYDEFGKAGGMLSGSAADAVKGVGLVSVRPNGVLFLVTTEVAFQALIGGSGHSVLEFVPVGTGFFDILVNARSWGPNHPLTLGGFRTLVSNAGEAGFTFRVGEPFVFRVRNGRRHILPNGKIATLGDIKPNGIYEPDFYHASPDGTRWIKGLFSTRAGGVPGAFLLEQGLTNNALQQQRLKGLIVGLERSDTGPDWTLASEARETAVTQASVAVTVGTATLTITLPARFTLGSGGAPGAEGNDWRLIFAQSGTAATIGVVVDRAAKTITTTTNPNGFNFGVARASLADGFLADVISTDIHAHSIERTVNSLADAGSKLMSLGVGLREVVERTTARAAAAIGREELGTLRPGTVADLAAFEIAEGEYEFHDCHKERNSGSRRIEPVLTVREGVPYRPEELREEVAETLRRAEEMSALTGKNFARFGWSPPAAG